jgi:hypothetical protein
MIGIGVAGRSEKNVKIIHIKLFFFLNLRMKWRRKRV